MARWVCSPLRLMLFPLEQLVVVSKMWRNPRINVVLRGHIMLDQPRRAVPCFPSDRFLNEGPQNRLGEYLPVAEYMVAVHHGLLVRSSVYASKISRDRLCESTVRKYLAAQARLISHYTSQTLPAAYRNGDSFAWVVVGFEFIVDHVDEGIDSRNSLELNTAQYGSLERLWEGLLNFLGAGKLYN